eukprot:COSAG05_NODE_1235_length_5438_cov_19.332272_6_plen_92_part_00
MLVAAHNAHVRIHAVWPNTLIHAFIKQGYFTLRAHGNLLKRYLQEAPSAHLVPLPHNRAVQDLTRMKRVRLHQVANNVALAIFVWPVQSTR